MLWGCLKTLCADCKILNYKKLKSIDGPCQSGQPVWRQRLGSGLYLTISIKVICCCRKSPDTFNCLFICVGFIDPPSISCVVV